MPTYDEDVRNLIAEGDRCGFDPVDAVWAVFDSRCELGNALVFEALHSSGLATPDELRDRIPTTMLEILARLLPAGCSNSPFDDLLDDLNPTEGD